MKKRKGAVHSGSSEETTDNIPVTTPYLKKHNDLKFEKKKEKPMELQGEFKKLRPPMFDGESEEVAEAWLLNINRYFQVLVNLSRLWSFIWDTFYAASASKRGDWKEVA